MHTITILWILTVSNTSWKIFESLPVSACIWEFACIQPGISAPVTVIQQSPQCISCIFVNISSLFICLFPFGNGWVKWTQDIMFSPGFWHLQFALSGGPQTSGKVLKKYACVLAMNRLLGISKRKKCMRERQNNRQEVSCSWTYGRYRSACTYIDTSSTTSEQPPQSNPKLPKAKPLRETWLSRQGRGDFCKRWDVKWVM